MPDVNPEPRTVDQQVDRSIRAQESARIEFSRRTGSQPPGSPGDSHPQVTSRLAFAARLYRPLYGGPRHAWRTPVRQAKEKGSVARIALCLQARPGPTAIVFQRSTSIRQALRSSWSTIAKPTKWVPMNSKKYCASSLYPSARTLSSESNSSAPSSLTNTGRQLRSRLKTRGSITRVWSAREARSSILRSMQWWPDGTQSHIARSCH